MKRQNGLVKLRKRATKDGGASLYLEIADGGNREYEYLQLYLVPERTRIDRIRNAETLRTAEAAKAQRIIELQNAAHGFSNSRTRGKTQLVRYIEEKGKEGSVSADEKFYELLYHLRKYAPKITVQDINRAFLIGFISHLRTVKTRTKKGRLSPNTIWTVCNKLNTFLNKAVRDDLILVNPFSKLGIEEKPKREPVPRSYLTAEELRRLAETDSRERRTDVKKAFMFCCFCGLRYSDAHALRWCDIRTLSDGSKQAEITQKKTKEPLYLPLSANALKWLPEQGGAPDTAPVFRLPTLGMCSRRLAEWCEAAGIEKRITYHVARHTAATLFLAYGADIYTVSKLLGHTDVRTTQIYAKVMDENKRRAVDAIPDI